MVGPFDYVYDRGGLVALPADVRYVTAALLNICRDTVNERVEVMIG